MKTRLHSASGITAVSDDGPRRGRGSNRRKNNGNSVCRAAGPGTRSTEAWTALVGVADAWSEYVMVRGILNHVADRAQSLALAGPATADTAGRGVRRRHQQRGCSSLGRNIAAGDARKCAVMSS